ncbi:MAG: ComF family protein [Treponema sp.]|nr:ComF family protein [Treponema sp.]MCL2250352.1 ComF family protein [Treponema sp.]
MNILYQIYLQLKHFLFPGACALCGGNLLKSNEIRLSLCSQCQAAVEPATCGSLCSLCGKPLITEIDTCLPCRNREQTDLGERYYERLWVIYPYIGKYRQLLTEYKFRKNLYLADFFAEKILEVIEREPELKDALSNEVSGIMIVPVPPRPGKIKESGWDQVDHLVKRMKKIKVCLSVTRCLKRKKSKVQKSLNRKDRIDNLKGKIYFKSKKELKTVLIIDDVLTTGSTMEVCASVLKAHGAEKVYGLCVFYD